MYRQRKQRCDCEGWGSEQFEAQQECGHPAEDAEEEYAESCGCRQHCMLPPETVREIRAAIDDELGAVAAYATLARKFKDDPVMQAWVTNIAGDEYGHARAFAMTLAAAGCANTMHHKDEHRCKR